jgi:hypothetical protein
MDVVSLQEAINLVAGFKAKQAPQIWLIEAAHPVFFRQQGFQGAAGEIAIPGVSKPLGDVVGNLERDFHAFTLRCENAAVDQTPTRCRRTPCPLSPVRYLQ